MRQMQPMLLDALPSERLRQVLNVTIVGVTSA